MRDTCVDVTYSNEITLKECGEFTKNQRGAAYDHIKSEARNLNFTRYVTSLFIEYSLKNARE